MSARATILVVDDDPSSRRLLRSILKDAYLVIVVDDAAAAITALDRAPDIVLLDLGLPDRDGLELLPLITRRSGASIIVVSGRAAVDDKVAALDLGATDYIVKPFDAAELLARVRAELRARAAGDGHRGIVMAGAVTIDLVKRRVTRNGGAVHLTPKEYGVLAELARFPGRAITHQHLLRSVWPRDRDGHIAYLRLVIRGMRQKLEADPASPALIVNEMGVGYRLIDAGDPVRSRPGYPARRRG